MDESAINTINRLKSDLAKLELKLKESPITEQEEPMLKCTGGRWYLGTFSKAYRAGAGYDWRITGIEHETEAEAIEAGKKRVQLEIINNHATRLNKEDGFVVDWEDIEQLKYYMVFSHLKKEWRYDYTFTMQPTGVTVMSVESVKYLEEKLNKGFIKGVNANGDI